MAEETSNGPASAAEPPKANPLASPALKPAGTLQMKPVIRKPTIGGGALKPGLKLPPKPAGTTPLKTVTTSSPLKAGLKMPATPTLKAGLKLPTKPVIRKPGSGVAPAPLKPAAPTPTAAAPAPAPAPAAPAPVAAPVAAPMVAKPVAAPVVAKPVAAPAVAKPISAEPASSSLTALKAVTQNLKSVTTAVPQQAILHKTGIIADPTKDMTEAQKQAAKSKTARISLSEAVGVAPVKNENAPMKTIRIKRPADISSNGPAAAAKTVVAAPVAAPVAAAPAAAAPAASAAKPADVSVTQRKTLKITRPSEGVVRPAGKFGIKKPAAPAAAAPAKPAAPGAAPAAGDVADIPDIPDIPSVAALPPVGVADDTVADVPAIVGVIGVIAQAAACVVIGALAWFLYQDAQVPLF